MVVAFERCELTVSLHELPADRLERELEHARSFSPAPRQPRLPASSIVGSAAHGLHHHHVATVPDMQSVKRYQTQAVNAGSRQAAGQQIPSY